MSVIEVNDLHYRYGAHTALEGVTLKVPEGAICALVGTNGAGKSTLLQILMGLRRPAEGTARVLGRDVVRLSAADRAEIGYIAEGMALPRWMRLRELEAYLAPLYPRWDAAFANELRERFRLDPARRLGTLSRGEHMKAAILCALAPRPRLLLLDEPFTGIDVIVKDEMIRGLLASAEEEGWSAMICSHDIAELEMLADWLAVLDGGRLRLADSMERVRERFVRVEAVIPDAVPPPRAGGASAWLTVERAGGRLSGIVDLSRAGPLERSSAVELAPGALEVESRPATLREIIAATGRGGSEPEPSSEEAAA